MARFWSWNTQYIRHSHHTYLGRDSLVIDVGGNVGKDSQALLDRYEPRWYVILEPLKVLHRRLVTKFASRPNVLLYNFGLAKKTSRFMVSVEGDGGEATSPFLAKSSEKTCPERRTL